jgi:RNA polymerase sigma factor (sigma-70 family)
MRKQKRVMRSIPALADSDNPELVLHRTEEAAILRMALDRLSEREARILKWRFGLDGQELSSMAVGALEGVSQERVRQIEANAINRLRRPSYWSFGIFSRPVIFSRPGVY